MDLIFFFLADQLSLVLVYFMCGSRQFFQCGPREAKSLDTPALQRKSNIYSWQVNS